MKPADAAAEETIESAEPQPWRTADDAQGWRVIGVGKRHPRWLEFEIAAIAARHDPVGLHGQGAPADEYRPAARILARELRMQDPVAATSENVSRLTHNTFARVYAGRPAGEEAAYRAMAEEIVTAWRAYAARMSQSAAGTTATGR